MVTDIFKGNLECYLNNAGIYIFLCFREEENNEEKEKSNKHEYFLYTHTKKKIHKNFTKYLLQPFCHLIQIYTKLIYNKI